MLMSLLVTACGGGGGSTPQSAITTDTATMGPSGGILTHADGVKITVPVGALTDALTLRVARDTTGMNAALLGVAPDPALSVELSPTYAMTPHGTRFAQPVELRIPLDKAAANGPGMLAVLRTEPGRGSWDLIPVGKVENGAAVVAIDGFSFYKAVRVVQMPVQLPQLPPAPPLLEMSATFDGVGPETYSYMAPVIGGTALAQGRRLYGEITSISQNLRYTGHVVGLPASCSTIVLSGAAGYPTSTRAEDSNIPWVADITQQPAFAQVNAAVGTSVTNGYTRPTLDFAYDLNYANRPYLLRVFEELRAANKTGATPTVAVSFNATAKCSTPVDLGGGSVFDTWVIAPGITQDLNAGWPGQVWWDLMGWKWNTVLYKLDYLPQGFITHPSNVTVAAGASASFSTSAAPTPVGEQRIEWWRSNNEGANWTRVRTSIVPVSDTADTYTLPSAAATDHNALFRARLCTVPRLASVAESCVDGIAARLSVIQGVAAASFVQQPRALLVRTGQTASLSVQVAGAPTPTLRWQSRPANSSAAWADVSDGTGATTANYSTAALSLSDNGLQLRAVANNLAGDVPSVTVTVSVSDVDVAPSITTQPASISVAAGGDAVFAVAAQGTEALSYQWRRDGTPITGANAPVLKLSAISAGDASGYSVQISNAAGNLTSDTATLTVTSGAPAAAAPTIVTQPVPVTVNTGNTATFAVGVSGTGPFTYQWLKGGQPISGATLAFYSIASAAGGDTGNYSVRVTNSVTAATSSSASLTVNANPVITAVSITSQPSPQIQLPGGSATFAVAATGTGPFSYQWQKDGSPITGATSAVLLFSNLQVSDVAAYSVTVSNSLGGVTSNAASLTVVGAPAINTQPANASAIEGATATFSVIATGTNLRYQWTRNGVGISSATSASYTTPTLTTLSDNGATYGVLVYNGAGLIFGQGAVLTVRTVIAPSVLQQPANLTIDAGLPANICMSFGGTAPFAVQMQRWDGAQWATIGSPIPFTDNNLTCVSTPNLQLADNGTQFHFVASNGSVLAATTNPVSVAVRSTVGSLVLVTNSGVTNGVNGLSVYRASTTTGALSFVSNANTGNSPYAVAVTPNGLYAYVTNLLGGTLSSFSIDKAAGTLTPIPLGSPGTVNPYGIAVDPFGYFLWVANFGSNEVSTFSIGTNGLPTAIGERATGLVFPRVLAVHPTGNFVYVTSEVSHNISVYSVNVNNGALTLMPGTMAYSVVTPNSMSFDPSGHYLFVADGSGSVVGFTVDVSNGFLSLPAYYPAPSQTTSVAVHPNGHYLYAVGSGVQSIWVYSIRPSDGALQGLGTGTVSTGSSPQSIVIDSSGSYLYVTNGGTNTVSTFNINASTGALTEVGTAKATGALPVGIAIAP
jgi:6-phosphogluconolactonase (cycloisomerase 2 family)